MNLFEFTLLNTIFTFFPLLLYLIYVAYSSNVDKKENNIFLEFALFSSLYLMIRYGQNIDGKNLPILMMNVPLIIAYIKNRPFSILMISILLVAYYFYFFEYSMILLIIEYIVYMFLFALKMKKNWTEDRFIHLFLFVKFIFSFYFLSQNYYQNIFSLSNIIEIVCMMMLLIAITYLLLLLFQKGEDIIKLHMTMKELEKEKQIQMSLFQITHEIKNPIAVCKGYLDMFDVNNVEHSQKYIPIMKEEINRILILLQDFLSIQKMKIEKDILDINLLLDEMMISLEPLFKEKKIDVYSSPLEDEIYMNGDYNRLKQVFINLIKNSIEAMNNEKKHILKLEVYELEKEIQIKITDNGIGIEEENLKKLKEAFFSTKKNGTGLGVYLSNEIVKAHDGKIDYESNSKGTTVILTFPKGL